MWNRIKKHGKCYGNNSIFKNNCWIKMQAYKTLGITAKEMTCASYFPIQNKTASSTIYVIHLKKNCSSKKEKMVGFMCLQMELNDNRRIVMSYRYIIVSCDWSKLHNSHFCNDIIMHISFWSHQMSMFIICTRCPPIREKDEY